MKRVFRNPKVLAMEISPAVTAVRAVAVAFEISKRAMEWALSVVEPWKAAAPRVGRVSPSTALWREWREAEAFNAVWEGVAAFVLMIAFFGMLFAAAFGS